jgi:hypothetical protein
VASRTSPASSSMSSTMTCLPRRPVAPLLSATPASNALLVLPHAAPLVSSRSPLLSLRVEMIQTDKINSTLKPLIQHSGGFPQRILYCCRRVEMIQTDADMKALIKNAPFLYTHSFGTCAATRRQPYLPARRPSATTATGNAIRERLLSLSSACRHHVAANPTSPASTTSSSLKGVRQDLQVTRRRQGREHQPPAWNMAGKPVQLPSSDPGLHPSRQGLDHLRSHQAPGSSARLGHPHSGVDQLPTAACSVTALPSVRRYAGCQGRLPGLVYGYIYIHTIPTVLASLSTPTLPPGVKENQRYPFNRDERQTANMGGPDPQFNLFKYLISEKRCCESRVSKDLKRLSRLRVSLVVANHRGANIVDEDNSLKSAKEHKFMQRNE